MKLKLELEPEQEEEQEQELKEEQEETFNKSCIVIKTSHNLCPEIFSINLRVLLLYIDHHRRKKNILAHELSWLGEVLSSQIFLSLLEL